MDELTRNLLIGWAETYNDPEYFREDPIAFPRRFAEMERAGKCSVRDVEVAAVFAAHFAWGRRAMIVRDCGRLFDEMSWRPYDYVMRGGWRCDPTSIHRTVKWSEVAAICSRLKALYEGLPSLESLSQEETRVRIFGQKPDPKAPNKKINMMRRWMVRNDGKVDLGLTSRKQKDLVTVKEITGVFDEIFPGDPCKGDFSLFGYGVTHPR